jgi:polar amino acid transport system substrate-binding protein
MKQLLQYNKQNGPRVIDLPAPQIKGRGLLVANRCSLISVGTERQMIEVSRMSLLSKARQRPDMVKQVFGKMKTEGIASTYNKVMGRLKTPVPLGYSSAGIVEIVQHSVENFVPGDRVACAGFGYACHAEKIFVPRNLCVKIPENVTFEEASFVTLGAIALQGVRLTETRLGETVVVIGLGLLGQITCMLLAASGCRVLGIDINPDKTRLAMQSGAEAAFVADGLEGTAVANFTAGHGADSVIITAASDSSKPIETAGEICRDKGRVTVVGAVKMDVPRKSFYDKELELRLSRSYGPGRYDYNYEEAGHDYPFGYVRWTENRNMQSFLQLISSGKINIKSLITHRFDIENAEKAYELISGKSGEKYSGIILNYPASNDDKSQFVAETINNTLHLPQPASRVGVGFVGAGNFASGVLLPKIASIGRFEAVSILSGSGVSAISAADRFNYQKMPSSFAEMLDDPYVTAVFIANRHDQHAEFVIEALARQKPVFVEKPLCLNQEELEKIKQAYYSAGAPMMVGFNRRFAPFVEKIREYIKDANYPFSMHYRINAGFIPSGTWIQDAESGGGRIIGEICHFVDLLTFLTGSKPTKVSAECLSMPDDRYRSDDNLQALIRFADGSVGTINYVASGNKAAPKEYLEIFGSGLAIMLDDFKTLTIIDAKGKKHLSRGQQNKGHAKMLELWAYYLQTGLGSPIPFEQAVDSTAATFEIINSISAGEPRWMKN